ncbi:alpha/beta fold hydrolase [Pseudofrankia inefficax]|uniref:Alpha/beta hydrolase fold protein n=1 Tax=Pseudofrankia inefficax (strain DSM 45817 / CECT 9037 / DDB 130130 / EuI1c) TaxID=298654 RepID=E3IWH4_PSEI1|nr:alpha/beta hydrolase [Pseudofrankia inefficax]ADP80157.1 alpha/beta hydrolase fold protein [Pseudofrankia inefficax]
MTQPPESITVDLPSLRLHALSWGPSGGRLVLCLHGFPDSAWSWARVATGLAERGFRVVAPFMRGYAPTGPAPDNSYHVAALMQDVLDLHEKLGGGREAVVVGHDWGAFVVNALLAYPDSPFAVHVTMSVPNVALLATARGAALRPLAPMLRQARNSWYVMFFQAPWLPERVLPRVIPRLWRQWGPSGRAPGADLFAALAALPTVRHRRAAVGYYRALARGTRPSGRYAWLHEYTLATPFHPVLHLQGQDDGAIVMRFTDVVASLLPAGSSVVRIPAAGHFLQIEQPAAVTEALLSRLCDSCPA